MIGCTQCVRACPTDVLEMIPWDGCKAKQIASAPRTEDCVGCKRCESACPTDFLSVRYSYSKNTRSLDLVYLVFTTNDFPWLTMIVVFFQYRPTGNRWTFYRNDFTDGIYYYFSYFSGFSSYSGFPTIPFPYVSNVQRSNRIIFFSGSFTFFHHVGIRIPVYLLLSMWGGKKRLYSATKFILYTAGSISLYGSNEPTLNLELLANQSYPITLEILFYIGFLIAFAVKSPIIPLHTWLPDTHGEAHYSTCMLLAGILLKMGAYGLVRINMELLPHAHSMFSPLLMVVGTIQIIYAASTSPGQRNLKKRIAYSSVSHMGFIIIGISSITDPGLNGAILQIISHGFIGAALFFFLAGTSYDRIRLVYLDEMGGMAISIPKIFTMFTILSMASLALPGMSAKNIS
ncbi:unnamed protein product [Thlaspi arvense]|uniref:Photosystem I iron-sulfur center n=1 Tax=Thlaspi arvense TaxID=13288 RepID=A0AAU9RW20_THLAR|nr:unnamed protein product [Thlaspi arvense]